MRTTREQGRAGAGRRPTVREATFDLLRELGMTTVFGNPGSTELPFLSGFPEDFSYVLGLHEGAVVGIADGYAQGRGRPALVNLHTASGLGNASAAIMTAYLNRTPLVIVAGQQDRRHLAAEPFLAGRLTEMAQPYVKWSSQPVRAEDVPAAIARAYHLAAQPPAGPAFVAVPQDDWEAVAGEVPRHRVVHRARPDERELERAARALEAARSPAIVAGAGVDRSGAWEDTVRLAEKLRAAAWADPFASRAGFPQDHPLFRGHLSPAQAALAEELSGHDVVLVLGAPVFRYYRYLPGPVVAEGTELLHVTDDPEEAARAPVGVSLVGDVALAVRHLLGSVRPSGRPAPQPPPAPPAPRAAEPLPVDYALYAVGRALPEEAVVVEETPSSKPLLHRYIRVRRPGGFYSAASGGLGFGVSAAVGLSIADPERPVVCVVGDGSLAYGLQALWSAGRYARRVVFVVLNNRQYRVLRLLARRDGLGGGLPGTGLEGLDPEGAARSLGCPAETVRGAGELEEALGRALASGGPRLLNVLVDPESPRDMWG
ncbi:thiamine pyrophosphate enzyme-like TPP binding region [Rubrobacter xylanophilus DSM 9941]|uniref:Thiamine pyrophosphate enzyme-like TPP binding region n=1 Tax=Rubrobacter xylanophilus (strain DSM 9941 / JCM 11954 / NBRC 16129 / PRD-1) TaxID=266117 RepID=Q1AVS4_RUBXD|nr:benzoylformate decarboxylase [Rubrobacter xylanophilus]ABG04504.1 thiamine pyrophosphate enzyme-like TPP binding region [Rubrobacter xylanophilus DSM 9941]